MKIRIYESLGFAGTESTYTEEVPQEIVEQGEEAIDNYIAEQYEGLWDNMCQRLNLSIELVENDSEEDDSD